MTHLPWAQIDTVLLDMDGTLLDLHFDNHFWLHYLPERYAAHYGFRFEQAQADLIARFATQQGQLTWYCLDYWTRVLGLPITEIKREMAHLVSLKPGVADFLDALQAAGKRTALITNAHPDSLSLKLERVNLSPWFDRLISSHQYGMPKEHPDFWVALQKDFAFDPTRTLFIDDSLPILRRAQCYGVAHLLAVCQPDSQQGEKDTEEFSGVTDYQILLKGLLNL